MHAECLPPERAAELATPLLGKLIFQDLVMNMNY